MTNMHLVFSVLTLLPDITCNDCVTAVVTILSSVYYITPSDFKVYFSRQAFSCYCKFPLVPQFPPANTYHWLHDILLTKHLQHSLPKWFKDAAKRQCVERWLMVHCTVCLSAAKMQANLTGDIILFYLKGREMLFQRQIECLTLLYI